MGGMGSGRRNQNGKDTTDEYRMLDVRLLQRNGLLTPGQSFGWSWKRHGKTVASIQMRTEADRVILKYRHKRGGDDWQDKEYPVSLVWTPCNYGGQRAWFLCPAKGCGRRVAILFLGSSGIFACRHCYRLAYACQRETAGDRAMRRADAIRIRLGWGAGIANPMGDKPRGMHWRTYGRLLTQLNTLTSASLRGTAEKLGMINRRLEGLMDNLPSSRGRN